MPPLQNPHKIQLLQSFYPIHETPLERGLCESFYFFIDAFLILSTK